MKHHSQLKKLAGDKFKDWAHVRPHFGMSAPHRYQATADEYAKTKAKEKVCVYCLRPETYK